MIRALKALVAAAFIFAACFYATPVKAEGLCPDWWGTMPLTSHHFDRRSNGERYNERNLGVGVECKATDALRLGLGYYRNSFKGDTFYVGAMYTPWRFLGGEWGGSVLLATGYTKEYPFVILPTGAATWEAERGSLRGWGVTVLIATTVLAVMVKRDF